MGLQLDELVNILKKCELIIEKKLGVYSMNKTPTITHGAYSWEELFGAANFIENYFDKMKVGQVKDLKL